MNNRKKVRSNLSLYCILYMCILAIAIDFFIWLCHLLALVIIAEFSFEFFRLLISTYLGQVVLQCRQARSKMYANAQACPVLVQCRGTEGGVFVYTAVRVLTCSSSSSSNICINTTASRLLSQLVSQLVTFYSSCSFCCPVFLFVLPFCGYVCHLLGNWRQKLHCGRNQLCFKLIYTERREREGAHVDTQCVNVRPKSLQSNYKTAKMLPGI